MLDANVGAVRLRQLVAGLAIVLVVSPGASAQSLFDPNPSTGPAPSRPFRVSFDGPKAAERLPGDLGRWSRLVWWELLRALWPARLSPGTAAAATTR